MSSTHYDALQVLPYADEDVIRAAYHKLAQLRRDNEEELKKLNIAKDVLLDTVKRKKYDKEISDYMNKVIGNYKIKKLIAEGGFGRTYLGEHVTLKSPVCIKQAYNVSEEDERILIEEAKAIWDLRHYGIPSIRDIMRLKDGSLVIVMSYIPGMTLTQVVESHGRLEPESVASITDRVLNILKYLHYHGIIHGDIKPQNIILQHETHGVVLVDYGLSVIRPSSKSESKGYTPHFAAPEQIRSNCPLLPETDLYGLGMVMIYALGGDIETKQVPIHTPDNMCKFLKKLIVHDVLSRPNWEKEDIQAKFQETREKDFGRRYSGMKKLF